MTAMILKSILSALKSGEISAADAKQRILELKQRDAQLERENQASPAIQQREPVASPTPSRASAQPCATENQAAQPPALKASAAQSVASTANTGQQQGFRSLYAVDKVAIIGQSGRYPGAENLNDYWQNLKNGVDSVQEVPTQRWNVAEYYDPRPNQPGKVYCKWLGAINEPEFFDPLFFNIAPAEAEAMDPQFRLFLQESYHAFEDAGYSPEALNAVKCGVYLGIINGEYNNFLVQQTGSQSATGASNAIGASRIAYYLNLKGPAIAMDTACSSSLVAMHIGCQNLLSGDIDMALIGGVSLYLTPTVFMSMCAAGMLSREGRCKTFDNSADGFVPGEGVGTVIMKRLSDAERDHDNIYATVIASGSNQDGKTNGITAPSKVSQTSLIREVYQRCGIDASSISYVDMHGTGTKLGDPIELEALANAFSEQTSQRHFCAIGSVKSNIGHSSAAAGVASIHKILLQMRAGELVPSLHFSHPNEHFDFAQSPFYVSTKNTPWESANHSKRRAAVSSFGYSGTNVHIVLEEYPQALPAAVFRQPELILLSAHSATQLQQQAQALITHISAANSSASTSTSTSHSPASPTSLNLANIAHTLRVGRGQFAHRMACVAESIEQLLPMLQQFVQGQPVPQLWQSAQKPTVHAADTLDDNPQLRGVIQQWIESVQFSKVAELWARGVTIPWRECWPATAHNKVSLPGYPFAREPYWPQMLEASPQQNSHSKAIALNTSDATLNSAFTEQPELPTQRLSHPLLPAAQQGAENTLQFPVQFTGDEFFFTDHQVQGRAILPAVAYLDLACAAMFAQWDATTTNRTQVPQNLIVKNTTWFAPFSPSAGQTKLALHLATTKKAGEYQFIATAENASNPCSQSVVTAIAADAPPVMELNALQQRCGQQHFTANELYAVFTSMGLQYGPAHQGAQAIHVGEAEVLAQVCLPASLPQQHGFVLHPAMLDAVLQTSLMLPSNSAGIGGARMPFALAELRLYRRLPNTVFAWIRSAKNSSERLQKLDVDICDSQGQVCVQLRGFSSREVATSPPKNAPIDDHSTIHASPERNSPERNAANNWVSTDVLQQEIDKSSTEKLHKLVPSWQSVTPPFIETLDTMSTTLIVSGPHHAALSDLLPQAKFCDISADTTVEGIQAQLQNHGKIERLIWLVPASKAVSATDECMITEQESGVRLGFRLVKALLALNYGVRALQLTIVTQNSQAIWTEEPLQPSHASIHGFIGSLSKEYHNWLVRLVDIDQQAMQSTKNQVWKDILRLSPHPFGDAYAYRQGEWFQRMLIPLVDSASNAPIPYRQNGTYIVVGGAGGIGRVWSDWVSRHYNAQVIWIGRREQDAQITQQIERIAEHGPAPWYVQADASDFNAFKTAIAEIRDRLGERDINGVIHSAIVLADKSVAKMDEETFSRSLDVKVAVSVNLAKAFAQKSENASLDWLCFFSSLQSFTKEPGQCNYAAGCTFKDALAQRLNNECSFPVKTVNWGFWGSVGVVSQDDYRERMANNGIGSIEPEEAMFALQELLAGRLSQWGLLKTLREEVLFNICPPSRVCVYPNVAHQMSFTIPQQTAALDTLVAEITAQLPVSTQLSFATAQALAQPDSRQLLDEHGVAESDVTVLKTAAFGISLHEELRNVKILMKTQGVLIVEFQARDLSPASALQALVSEGFNAAQIVDSQSLLVVATSDGCVLIPRQQIAHVQQVVEARPLPKNTVVANASTTANTGDSRTSHELTVGYLLHAVSKVLKVPIDKLDADIPLEVYGLDSILSVQLTSLLSADISEISSTIFFEFPTVTAVAEYLTQEHTDDLQQLFFGENSEGLLDAPANDSLPHHKDSQNEVATNASTLVNPSTPVTSHTSDSPSLNDPSDPTNTAIAVIGMACKMPNAETTEQLWQNLMAGKDAVTEVPASRWDHSLYFDADKSQLGKTACKWGSFVDGIDQFDPLFFNISPNDAEFIDPQVRLMLHTSWALMEASGYTREKFRECCESNVGVYIGAHNQQYQLLETDYVISAAMSASAIASIPNRISSFLDLCGPSFAIDTFCSSSMIAIHSACNDLRLGETDMAIAGGINHLIHPKRYLALGMAMLLGSDHTQSRSFGCGDGFIPSEGAGVIMLKRLQDAERDNDEILAVVKSTLQYHGGAGTGYGTTNQQAYSQLIRKNFAKAGIAPSSVSFVESAANGNALSDAVAISAMKSFFKQHEMPNNTCGLGSIKSNFGHLEAASGVMQFIKVVLQMQHKQLPPTIYAEPMNPNIQLENSPFVVHREVTEWQVPSSANNPEGLRRAVVNTFGGGGSLAQAILEEYVTHVDAEPSKREHTALLIPLSARSAYSLQQRVQQLQVFINEQPETSLSQLSHTLIYGREAMEYRCAFVASDLQTLSEQLDDWVTAYQLQKSEGTAPANNDTPPLFSHVFSSSYAKTDIALAENSPQYTEQLQAIAQRWLQGESFNWHGLFSADAYRTLALPSYPFDTRRCWAEPVEKLGYHDSKLLNVTTSFEEANQINTETLGRYIHSTNAAFLGLTTQELSIHEPLSRYQLLAAFLPRLMFHLRERLDIRIDSEAIMSCRTTAEIIDLLSDGNSEMNVPFKQTAEKKPVRRKRAAGKKRVSKKVES